MSFPNPSDIQIDQGSSSVAPQPAIVSQEDLLGRLALYLQTLVEDPHQPRFPIPPDVGPLLDFSTANLCRKAYLDGSRSLYSEQITEPDIPDGASSALQNVLWEYFFIGFRHSEHRKNQALAPAVAPATPAPAPVLAPGAVAVPVEAQAQYIRPQKLAEPDPFTGVPGKCKEFLSQLALIFNNDPRQYKDNDMAKLSKAISYLRGNARTWATPLINADTGVIKSISYEDFTKQLKAAFGDPDEVRTAERQLDALRQTSSCSAYVAQFTSLASLLPNWSDNKEAWLLKFRKGLKQEIRDMLLYYPKEPHDFDELTQLCIQLDNKLHAHQAEKRQASGGSSSSSGAKKSNSSSSSRSPVTTTPKTSSGTAPGPMELDTTRRGPLTEKEKKHRRDNNLCAYCGGEGHYAASCPKKKGNRKKQGAAGAKVNGKAESGSTKEAKVETVTPNASALYQISGPKN